MSRTSGPRRLVSLLIAAIASISLYAQNAPLRLVSTPWPPFTNETEPRFALDLVEAALGRVNLTATTTIVEPARFTPSLLSNAFDGSAAAWKDPERESVLVFSQPYLENRLILVGRRDEDVSAASITDLKGKRIAIVEGYAYGEGITSSGATLVPSHSEEDSLAQLLASKADYVLMDDLVVQFILDNYPDQAKTRLNVGSKPLLTRPLYFALRKTYPNAATIVSRFNAQLRGMIADKTYHRLLHVTWIRADVDGDGIPGTSRKATSPVRFSPSMPTHCSPHRALPRGRRASTTAAPSTPIGPRCRTDTRLRIRDTPIRRARRPVFSGSCGDLRRSRR